MSDDYEEIGMEVNEASLSDQELQEAVEQAIEENEAHLDDYEDEPSGVLNYLVGQVMEITGDRASPNRVYMYVEDEVEQQTK